MAGNADPIDLVAGLPDATPVSKGDFRSYEKSRIILRMQSVSEVRAADLSTRYVIFIGSKLYVKDTTDTVTVDDGDTCILDANGIRFKQNTDNRFSNIAIEFAALEASVSALQAAQSGLAIGFETWALLNVVTGSFVGQLGIVTVSDDGNTHTDPVVGGTVDNPGLYRWATSPATGWKRIANDETASNALNTAARLADLIPGGSQTAGAFPFVDSKSKLSFGHDPSTGPAAVLGDRPPNLFPIHVWLYYGQSQIGVGAGNAASQPPISLLPRRPLRVLMYNSCGLIGLANTDITTLDLSEIVAARESVSETPTTGIFTQLLNYEDALRMATPARLVINVAYSGAAYTVLKIGTIPFSNGLAGVQALVDRFGRGSIIVDGIVVSHGAANDADSKATYLTHLQEWYDTSNDTATADSLMAVIRYQGTWDANANSPTITSSAGTKGQYYRVETAGATSIDGLSTWNVGDTIVFDGSVWRRNMLGLRSITGQRAIIPMYCSIQAYVTNPGTYPNGAANAADAFLQAHSDALASSANRRIFVTGSEYQFFCGDAYHMNQKPKFEWGAQIGQSIAELKYTGANGVFWPQSATIDGGDIVLATNALSDLVIDTSNIPDRGDKGFAVCDAAVASITGLQKQLTTWDASTNSPALASGVGTQGAYYIVGVAGSTSIDGNASWSIGDTILFDGSVWRKNYIKKINNISVSGTSIRITPSTAPSAGQIVKYARIDTRPTVFGPGGTGNIRDSRNTKIAWGGTKPMYQWMLHSNTTVT